mgnify:CR=1 FL=1
MVMYALSIAFIVFITTAANMEVGGWLVTALRVRVLLRCLGLNVQRVPPRMCHTDPICLVRRSPVSWLSNVRRV